VQDASAQELESGTAIHGPLQHFEPVDLAFYRACCPRQLQRCLNSGDVTPQSYRKVFQRRGDGPPSVVSRYTWWRHLILGASLGVLARHRFGATDYCTIAQ
jgi:hypothetical protein